MQKIIVLMIMMYCSYSVSCESRLLQYRTYGAPCSDSLIKAAEFGDKFRVSHLLAAGVPVDVTNQYGQTPLYLAAWHGYMPLVKFLLNNNANINHKTTMRNSVLHEALLRGHDDIVEVLIAHGADIHIRDNSGKTALHWAVATGKENIVKLLLAYGADSFISDNDGCTAFTIPISQVNKKRCSCKNNRCARIMLKVYTALYKHVDQNPPGKLYVAYQQALENGYYSLVEKCIIKGVKPHKEHVQLVKKIYIKKSNKKDTGVAPYRAIGRLLIGYLRYIDGVSFCKQSPISKSGICGMHGGKLPKDVINRINFYLS
ncbi:MAG: ankyrin repeat domain-containing protein [Candidatus Babeliaceae bacterium]|jgi:hypothetical protein